ncbi:Uncharacterised protein [Vibrio cholerae]|uniref:Uncharacterized protein n=1 Tax=Vibrio cholerae TaxID=666 RepID=A0A655UFZ2_VIBCL|nr:Uncharacterised protein [Vibrio cholerae]CSA54664.1 Uncharacterised protein [Vibrio cholerae]CSB50238.1 Uncharacterised protein [Vibrio cholerae]CSC34853.1 Uncharacterised protein [Vibrio cholerae]
MRSQLAVFIAVRAVVVIKANIEASKVALVLFAHHLDHRFWCHTHLLCFQHDRCAVRIIRTDEVYCIATQTLITNPNVSLDMLKHMTKVD